MSKCNSDSSLTGDTVTEEVIVKTDRWGETIWGITVYVDGVDVANHIALVRLEPLTDEGHRHERRWMAIEDSWTIGIQAGGQSLGDLVLVLTRVGDEHVVFRVTMPAMPTFY